WRPPLGATTGHWDVARIRTLARLSPRTADHLSRSRWPTGHDPPARILRARWSSLTAEGCSGQNGPFAEFSADVSTGPSRTESSVWAQNLTILSRRAESSDNTSASPRPRARSRVVWRA